MIDKHKRFCDEYLIDCNGARAYHAVYGGDKEQARIKASKLLTKDNVKEYIQNKMKEIASEKVATAEEVIQYLTSVMRGEETEYLLNAKGEPTQIEVTAKDRIKCAELLAKRYGILTEKTKIEGAVPIVIKDDLDDD